MFNQSPEVLSQQFLPAGGVPLAHIVIDGSHDLVGELQPCSKRIRLQFKTDRTQYRTAHAHWPHQTELLAGIEIGDGGIESAALFLLKLLIKAPSGMGFRDAQWNARNQSDVPTMHPPEESGPQRLAAALLQ